MKGILIDDNNELVFDVKRDSNGLITQGLVVGNNDYQRTRLVVEAQKGEFKEAPILGFGIDSYLKQPVTAHGRQKFVTELKSELSSVGITATVKVDGNDISKFEIDI